MKGLKLKLALLSVLGILPIALGVVFYLFPVFESYFIEQRKEEVKASVDLTTSMIEGIHKQVLEKKLDEETAKQQIKAIIHSLRYNKTDYMFIYDLNGTVFAHGNIADMEGVNRIEFKDSDGKTYVREFISTVKNLGAGFVPYKFPKEKNGVPLEKISYVRGFAPWNWLIGSGLYYDNIQATIFAFKMKVLTGCGLLALVTLFLSGLYSRRLSGTLDEISQGLRQGANQVAQVAQQVAGASEQLSSATIQQSAALQETSASVEQTSSMTTKNAENSKRSLDLSERCQDTVARGKTSVEEVIRAIDEISKSNGEIMRQVEHGNQTISGVVEVINEIGAKTKVIDEIVFQTKLLSFNASVEAARAGEHGKGFAVVAQEIGSLAQMSGASAKEITELLDVSIKKVEEAISKTQGQIEKILESGKQKVDQGVVIAGQCNEILDEIVQNVRHGGQMVSEIASASEEQAKGICEINKAIADLDSVSKQNSTASQESAKSAKMLQEQVVVLRGMITKLDQTIQGASNQGGPTNCSEFIKRSGSDKT